MIKSVGHVLTNETPLPYRQDQPPCTPRHHQAIQAANRTRIERLPAPSRGLCLRPSWSYGGRPDVRPLNPGYGQTHNHLTPTAGPYLLGTNPEPISRDGDKAQAYLNYFAMN
jgi:hypothetical protein